MPHVKGNDSAYIAALESGKVKMTSGEYLGWLDGLHVDDVVFVKVNSQHAEETRHITEGQHKIVAASLSTLRFENAIGDFDRATGTLTHVENKRMVLAKIWPSQKVYDIAPKSMKGK